MEALEKDGVHSHEMILVEGRLPESLDDEVEEVDDQSLAVFDDANGERLKRAQSQLSPPQEGFLV